jgi:hypothetical protein
MLQKYLAVTILLLSFLHVPIFPQVKNQKSLNNFYLWQNRDAIINTYGLPGATGLKENSHWESYQLEKNCDMYFEVLDTMPSYIYSIQITGFTRNMTPFAGIKLGDSEKKIISIFGDPDKILQKPGNKYLCLYDNKNYSFLMYEKKLYSIKIGCYQDLFDNNFEVDSWKEIKKCILSKNANHLIDYLRPDFEIYYYGEIFQAFNKPFGLFKLEKKDIIYKLLFGDTKSVYKQILLDHDNEDEVFRLIKGVGLGEVIKFSNNKIVDEIVLMPYDGMLKVYEIRFHTME